MKFESTAIKRSAEMIIGPTTWSVSYVRASVCQEGQEKNRSEQVNEGVRREERGSAHQSFLDPASESSLSVAGR